MSDVAALIADMVRAGVDPDLIGRTAAALSEKTAKDPVAERRRAYDRERKAAAKASRSTGIPPESAESADQALSPKERSPTPPKEITPIHSEAKASSITPRAELETVLDTVRAKAVIDHRQRIGKPLTAHAARLLAGKLGKWPDPNFAADEMISNGWQGFKPEWLENKQRGSPRDGPLKPMTIGDMFREDARQNGFLNDQPASNFTGRMEAGDGSREVPGASDARILTFARNVSGGFG